MDDLVIELVQHPKGSRAVKRSKKNGNGDKPSISEPFNVNFPKYRTAINRGTCHSVAFSNPQTQAHNILTGVPINILWMILDHLHPRCLVLLKRTCTYWAGATDYSLCGFTVSIVENPTLLEAYVMETYLKQFYTHYNGKKNIVFTSTKKCLPKNTTVPSRFEMFLNTSMMMPLDMLYQLWVGKSVPLSDNSYDLISKTSSSYVNMCANSATVAFPPYHSSSECGVKEPFFWGDVNFAHLYTPIWDVYSSNENLTLYSISSVAYWNTHYASGCFGYGSEICCVKNTSTSVGKMLFGCGISRLLAPLSEYDYQHITDSDLPYINISDIEGGGIDTKRIECNDLKKLLLICGRYCVPIHPIHPIHPILYSQL